MKTTVPFIKEVKFNTKIYEICSMSLEHEINIQEEEIKGDFIITGEYRPNEISLTKEKFLYRLPFSVDIFESIKKDTVNFNIDDFYYDVVGDDALKLNIEFSVEAETEEKEEVRAEENEKIFQKPEKIYDEIEVPIIEEPRLEVSSESIINSISKEDETYTKYHVHIIRENDTLESICTMYNTNIDLIKQYNGSDELILNNKLIIPEIYE